MQGDAPEPVEILLVDDREENLLALEAVLASNQYRLIKVTSGEQALRYLLDANPAVILMDVQMPNLDGYETATILKSSPRTREIPIIFVTALNQDERYTLKGYDSGAVDYIYKPYDAHILRSKVAVFVDLYRKNQRLLLHEQELRESEAKERERKIAELELKSLRREQLEQKRYRHLVDGINHGVVWSADPNTMAFSFVSPSAEKLLGYGSETWIRTLGFWEKHLTPNDYREFQNAVKTAIAEQRDVEVEHRFSKANGDQAWLQTGLRVTHNNDIPELRGLSIDITKIKAAEEALQHAKRRTDFLARASLKLTCSFDYKANINEIAQLGVQHIADFMMVEIMNDAGEVKIIAMAHRDSLATLVPETFHQPSKRQAEALRLNRGLLARDGDDTYSSLITVPLSARGAPLGFLTFGQNRSSRPFDESDLSLAEDLGFRISSALDTAKLFDQAQAAIRIRDEFLSIASHELKTPLTPLKLHTQQLMRTLSSKPVAELKADRVNKMLEASNRQIERLSHLIDDLLDISRISTGRLSIQIEEFDLGQLIDEVLTRFSGQLRNAECDVKTSIDKNMMVRLDPYRIEQVLINLLTNAIKYGQSKPIEIEAHKTGEHVQMSFKDNGIGIAPEDQSRIFRRFERAVSGNHFGGLGLGLYIVTQILDAHGGDIRVESTYGEGAKFIVDLPAEAVTQQESQPDTLLSPKTF